MAVTPTNDVLQGIQGIVDTWALDINTYVMRILSNNALSYMIAKGLNPIAPSQNGGYGTVSYRKPQILQTHTYSGTNNKHVQTPQASLVNVNVDKMAYVIYEPEFFDVQRLNDNSKQILGMIQASFAISVAQTMNMILLTKIVACAKNAPVTLTGTDSVNTIISNSIDLSGKVRVLNHLGKTTTNPNQPTEEQVFAEYQSLAQDKLDLTRTYTMEMAGVNPDEFFLVLAPQVRLQLQKMYRYQLVGGAKWLANDDNNITLGGLKIYFDNQLDLKVPVNTSFNAMGELNTNNLIGFLTHKENIILPMFPQLSRVVINYENGNTRFIYRWLYTVDFLRPNLMKIYKNKGSTIADTTSNSASFN